MGKLPSEKVDILVAGAGAAGLSFALYAAKRFPEKHILLLAKGAISDSNSFYAQGGVAAVMDQLRDSFEEHVQDTLLAGDGLCDEAIVRGVVEEGPRRMQDLMDWGLAFDRKSEELDLAREGGHSSHRVLHVKDHSGRSIVQQLVAALAEFPNVELRFNQQATAILKTEDGRCAGLRLATVEGLKNILAEHTLLATGGAGQLYRHTSNPESATGDGLALALKAGLKLKGMAFVQFHPTVLIRPEGRDFLLSEAMRGFGAILRNEAEEDFMLRYHPLGSLATRDIVSRGIYHELQSSGSKQVYLDLRHLDPSALSEEFPTIVTEIRGQGLDPSKDMIPVAPAAHYFCGGIPCDARGATELPGLWVAGEVAHTGLHGGNRLASNSLLEALVFAHRAAQAIDFRETIEDLEEAALETFGYPDVAAQTLKLQEILFEKVGVVRNRKDLETAAELVAQIQRSRQITNHTRPEDLALEHLLWVAQALIEDSLNQKENRGAFFREDLR